MHYPILSKKELAKDIVEIIFAAPQIAKNTKPGNFIIIRNEEKGERYPLTLADWGDGQIKVVVQSIGYSTRQLIQKDEVHDILGPLGRPTEIKKYGRVGIVVGGVGAAMSLAQIKAFKAAGNYVAVIYGARNKELIFWKDELEKEAHKVIFTTDDGSFGEKGNVVDVLKRHHLSLDYILTIGPPIMMKFVSMWAKENNIEVTASLTAHMIDGIGMCGGCKVKIGSETRFACVDGPEFDGTKVDWNSMINKLSQYREEECRLYGTKS